LTNDNPLASNDPLPPRPPVVVNLAIDFDGTLTWNGTSVDRKIMSTRRD
jgi:hypothetical protein